VLEEITNVKTVVIIYLTEGFIGNLTLKPTYGISSLTGIRDILVNKFKLSY